MKGGLGSLKTQLEEIKNNQGDLVFPDKVTLSIEEFIRLKEEIAGLTIELLLINLNQRKTPKLIIIT